VFGKNDKNVEKDWKKVEVEEFLMAIIYRYLISIVFHGGFQGILEA
jgi:hypothetical protein